MAFEGHCLVVWAVSYTHVTLPTRWGVEVSMSALGAELAARRPTMPMGLWAVDKIL